MNQCCVSIPTTLYGELFSDVIDIWGVWEVRYGLRFLFNQVEEAENQSKHSQWHNGVI